MKLGKGTTVDHLKRICRDDAQVLDMIDELLQRPAGGQPGNQNAKGEEKTICDNVPGRSSPEPLAPTGNSREKGLRRRRKDRPDLHARVLAGELSVHRAMVLAGFRKKLTAFFGWY